MKNNIMKSMFLAVCLGLGLQPQSPAGEARSTGWILSRLQESTDLLQSFAKKHPKGSILGALFVPLFYFGIHAIWDSQRQIREKQKEQREQKEQKEHKKQQEMAFLLIKTIKEMLYDLQIFNPEDEASCKNVARIACHKIAIPRTDLNYGTWFDFYVKNKSGARLA